MQLELSFFQSTIARRMFIMFIACALVPIILLALVAFTHYPVQFKSRALELLQRCAKNQGMSIYEHLLSAEEEMLHIRDTLSDTTVSQLISPQAFLGSSSSTMFKWLGVYRSGQFATLAGDEKALHVMESSIESKLSESSQILYVSHGSDDSPAFIYMVQRIHSTRQPARYLIGVLNADYLWGSLNGSWLPDGMEFCIWDQTGLIRQVPVPEMEARRFLTAKWVGRGRNSMEGKAVYAGRWVIFLKHHFLSPSWTIAMFQSKAQVMAPVTVFSHYLFLIIGAILVLLMLLTSIMVRKSLVPIEQLMDGVRQISRNRYGHRVQVASHDEFQDLAQAFNHMSNQLEIQFRRLTMRSDLDRKILSLLDTEKIVMAVLDQAHAYFPSRTGAVTILSGTAQKDCKTYIPSATGRGFEVIAYRLSQTEERQLLEHGMRWLEIEPGTTQLEFLQPLQHEDVSRFVIIPVMVQQRLFAIVSFGVDNNSVYNADDLQQARELANQLAVAFSNANLLSELKELNWGTLHALARTVDAKSSWTAGHSVRVMRTCLDIGRTMNLSTEALNDLHRSALLHDIGKLGVPVSILNKEGQLTTEERDLMQTHPDIGVRILSPIKAYESLLPIIHQHHERHDGKGYPLGLCADQIHQSARIIAVADTFDALVSDRPYRRGMPVEQAVELIKQLAGSQLDPVVVEAFIYAVKNLHNDAITLAQNEKHRIHA